MEMTIVLIISEVELHLPTGLTSTWLDMPTSHIPQNTLHHTGPVHITE